MHPAHFNLHPAHLSVHPQLSATPSMLFEPWYSTYQAISPNLGPKIQSFLFWLKIGPLGNLEVLNPNPDLVFWSLDPKTYCLENFDRKSQSYHFFLKIGTHGIWRMLILIPTLVFWIFNSKSIFGQIWAKKVKVVYVGWKLAQEYREDADFYSVIRFLNFLPEIYFWANMDWKSLKLFVLPENWHIEYLEDANLIATIVF